MNFRENKYGILPYNPPEKLITETEYRNRVDLLKKDRNLTVADEKFFNEIESLRNDLYDMIVYNNETVEVKGQKYYVSNSGDDNNDGKTPETAWKTLEKVRYFEFSFGDGVFFKRGDKWFGNTKAQNGVTYSAYGEGPKPLISLSYDASDETDWLKTETPDIWMFREELSDKDIGLIVFNGGESYGQKKRKLKDMKNDFDFCFCAEVSDEEDTDNRLYIYSQKGNPAALFEKVDLSRAGSVFEMENHAHDIVINNIAICYGQDYFFPGGLSNTEVSYCTFAWLGGSYMAKYGSRAGGGGGAWHSCDNLHLHHCFFTQQFDTAASPQFSGPAPDDPVFKDYTLTDSLIEYTEYSFEFFTSQSNGDKNCYEDMHVAYNIMRFSGKGFGDKHHVSRHIKGWSFHENHCYNCSFENNIFDRAESMVLEVTSRSDKYRSKTETMTVDYDLLPKFKGNLYIEPRGKQYAEINRVLYTFDKPAQITLKKLGVEEDSVFVFVPEE